MKRLVIDENGIRMDGFDEDMAVPEVDRASITFVRALLWGVQRILEVTEHVEASKRAKNELTAQLLQARQRTRSGLH